MTGTPRSFAGTPHEQRPDFDVLEQSLRAIRLAGSVFLKARFTEPFGIVSPKRFDAGTPLSHLRHVSVFHLVASGSCSIEIASGERRTIEAGDVLLLPFADRHTFRRGDIADPALAPDVMRQSPIRGIWEIDHGGGGEATRMVCGFIESSEFLFAPVLRSLPALLVANTRDDRVSFLLTSTVEQILTLAEAATPGAELMLGRLMEMLFIEVVRRHAAALPPGARGWFAALNEPVVGRALGAVHGDPARHWTVETLAREAGASRTVLNERFRAVLGQTPIGYITGWRLQLAAERLRTGTESLAAIAADVGYESEAAFSRAFKRATGTSPGAWRSSRRESG